MVACDIDGFDIKSLERIISPAEGYFTKHLGCHQWYRSIGDAAICRLQIRHTNRR